MGRSKYFPVYDSNAEWAGRIFYFGPAIEMAGPAQLKRL